jgi:hypothetical protein
MVPGNFRPPASDLYFTVGLMLFFLENSKNDRRMRNE